jgi:uncharacterized protein (TIGR04255 family)
MPWRPVNPAHAIERVRFVVQLKQELPDKLIRQISEKTQSEQHETRLQGPTPLQGLKVNFQIVEGRQHVFTPEANTGGAQFTRTAANNLPIEVFAVGGNQIAYETAEYRRWSTFRQRYMKVVQEPLKLVMQALDVEFVSLEFLDRFVFDGDRSHAEPSSLLQHVGKFLDEDTLSGRNMWHLHRGWFHKAEHGDILINQNFDAVDLVQVGSQEPSRTISVLTKADARALNYQIEAVSIVELLDFLHIRTKMQFMNALLPEMLATVGIGEEKV